MDWKLLLKDKCIALCIFLFSFILYLKTTSQTVFWGDSGELVFAVYSLGIPHPSGYPLFVLLGKLFTLIPAGTIAFRMHIMAGFFAALTLVIVYILTRRIVNSKICSLCSVIALMLSYLFWLQATITEVYMLNLFFIVLLLFLLVKFIETKSNRFIYLFALVLGLSLTNHISIIIFVPIFIYMIFSVKKESKTGKKKKGKKTQDRIAWNLLNPKTIALIIILFVLGLSLYAYLPIRSAQDPELDWGNPENIQDFYKHVTGKQYEKKISFQFRVDVFAESVFFILTQYSVLVIAGLLGILFLFNKNRIIFYASTYVFFANLIYNSFYHITDIVYYYLPALFVFSVWIGVGFYYLSSKFLKKRTKKTITHKITMNQLIRLAFVAVTIALVLFGSFSIAKGTNIPLDKSDYNLTRDMAVSVFSSAENDSIIWIKYSNAWGVLLYYQKAEKKRPDLKIVMHNLGHEWYIKMLKKDHPDLLINMFDTQETFIEKNKDTAAIYILDDSKLLEFDKNVHLNRVD